MPGKIISIIKERRDGERRAILMPAQVSLIVNSGYKVLVEEGCGAEAGQSDDDYKNAGAEIESRNTVWTLANVVIKHKAPIKEEYRYFRPSLSLAAFMHAEGDIPLVEAMCDSGMEAYAIEFFQNEFGNMPGSVSGSEISGKLAVIQAAYHLQAHMGGSGKLLSHIPGSPRPKVVIIGYGNAGGSAARAAASLGADVVVFGSRWDRLRQFSATVPSEVQCKLNEQKVLEKEVISADVVIGAILISTYDTPSMVSEDVIKKMRKGSIIIDITCGYGSGYMPSFDRTTTHHNPMYKKFGVLHCKIDAMPAAVPFTAARATSYNLWRYLLNFARMKCEGKYDLTSANGLIVKKNRIVHPEVMRHYQMGC